MKRLIEFLLPRESREHVLGDLEEIGFSWRNLASVLPRIWWRHLWTPYVPSWAGATDEDFHRRVMEHYSKPGITRLVLPTAYCLLTLSGHPPLWVVMFTLVCLLLQLLRPSAPRLNQVRGPKTWRSYYLQGLKIRCYSARAALFLLLLAMVALRDSPFRSESKSPRGVSLSVSALALIDFVHRLRSARREMRSIPSEDRQ